MDALKLLFGFSPWIAFWFIAGGHSMLRLQVGIGVATLLVVVLALLGLQRGIILAASVVFFVFALVAVAFYQNMWVIQHLGILASGTLFTTSLLSIATGHPFTESYAREHVPRELWDSPQFLRSNYTITGVWTLIFLASTLLNVAKPHYPELGEWVFHGMELGIMVSGVAFTTIYARRAKRRREAPGKNP